MMLASIRSGPAFGVMVVALIIAFAPALARRVGLPGLIGLLVGGAIVGPDVLGVIQRSTVLEAVGEIGVLYLVFLAGLELDLKTFGRYRTVSVTFGLATAVLPWALGTVVALGFDIDLRAAILIGSFWASFTLVSYGVVNRYGLTRVPSVAATVGASAITDTIGLVALAVIVGAETGGSGGVRLGLEIAAGLVGLALFSLVVLPGIVRWFFAGMGQERELRFVMVLAAFTSAAVVAEAFAIEALIGAFFAGIGLNRLVPNRSALMARTAFFGNALFIPAFIVSVGLLVDPAVMADARTFGLATGFAVALVVGKAIAAWVVGTLHGFPSAEIGLMFSLSAAQAAATLASTIIGFEIGLFGVDVVNAVVLVIVVSLLISAVGANRFAPRIEVDHDRDRRLGETIVVPADGQGDLTPLLQVAGRLAHFDGGVVLPLVVSTDGGDDDLRSSRRLAEQLDDTLRRLGLTGDAEVRIDRSIAGGVTRTALEHDASLVLVPSTRGRDVRRFLFGDISDELASSAGRPVALVALNGFAWTRIIVPIDAEDLRPANRADAIMVLDLVAALTRRGIEVIVGPIGADDLSSVDLDPPVDAGFVPRDEDRLTWLTSLGRPDDLIVTCGRDHPSNLVRADGWRDRSVVVASANGGTHGPADGALGWTSRPDLGSTPIHPGPVAPEPTTR